MFKNRELITRNKKIYLKKVKINFEKIINFENKMLVKTLFSTCKHGTENWIINQKAHWLKYIRDKNSNIFTEKLNVNQKKNYNLGNMAIGRIIKVGPQTKKYKKKDIVLMYGSASDYQVAECKDIITKIKKNVPIENYLCFDPLEFVVGALRESKFKIGDKIGIVGLGALGLVSLLLLKKMDINQIVCVDISNSRLKEAKKIGAHILLNSKIKKNIENYRTKTNPTGLDVVIDFSGSTSGLNTGISLCKYNGKVICGSMYDDDNSGLKLSREFHWNNIELVSSRICNEPQKDFPAWNRNRIHQLVIELIESKKYNFKSIIKKIYPFKNALNLYKGNQKNNLITKLAFKHNEKL